MLPQYALKIYNSEHDVSHIEIADVTNGVLGSFHPIRKMDVETLSSVFGNIANGCVKISPMEKEYELIHLDVSNGIVKHISFTYTFTSMVKINLKGSKNPTAMVMLPKLLFEIVGRQVYIYFIEKNGKKGNELYCYNAFLPNVNSSGGLCMGNVGIPKLSGIINTSAIMKELVDGITKNAFSHSSLESLNLDQMVELLENGMYTKCENYNPIFKLTDHYEGKKNI